MKRENIEDIYELSPLQEGMLFHTLSLPGTGMYFDQTGFLLTGPLDMQALERAWQQVLNRHAILRTSFHWEGMKKPLQVVNRNVKLPVEHLDWRGSSFSHDQKHQLELFLEADRRRGFELGRAPLLRITVITLAENSFYLVFSLHHMLLDGWSSDLIFKEATRFFEAYGRGDHLELPPCRPYGDYIAWLQRQDLTKAEAYWRKRLEGYKGASSYIGRAPRTLDEQAEFDAYQTRIARGTSNALNKFARQHKLTLNTIMTGAWALLLSRYLDEEDILFGTVVSGRPESLEGVETMVGLFINTQPVRTNVSPNSELVPWLRELQASQAKAHEFEYTPLVQIQTWCEAPRDRPLFETLLGFANFPSGVGSQANGLPSEIRSFGKTNYPLGLIVSPGDEIGIHVLYMASRFDRKSVHRMIEQLEVLLENISVSSGKRLRDLQLSSKAERHKLLVEWNQTDAPYPSDTCVHHLFEKWATQLPAAPAVSCDREHMTYGELNQRANRIAHALRGRRVARGVPVAICMKRSAAMIAAVLAAVKAGGPYVPLDPAYPKETLRYMLRDSGAAVLLTTRDLATTIPAGDCDVLFVDSEEIAISPEHNPTNITSAEDPAYIIYTSGSTGRPHAVEVRHQSLMNLVWWHHREYAVTTTDRATQIAGFGFDASVWEIWPYLAAGASIHVIDDLTRNSRTSLIECLVAKGITLSFLPTALAEIVLEGEWPGKTRLRALLTGGDKLHRSPPPGLPFRLVNHYGPTENAVVATFATIEPGSDATPSIGRPISNVRVYVVDESGELAPIGVAGELCIAGRSLASGYRNLPDLTAAKFVPDRFSGLAGERLYRTGDRVRYRDDGCLEFLGRMDAQVKVRGFRIEPGEVETVLAQHPAVRESAVVVSEDEHHNARLVAYVVGQDKRVLAEIGDRPREHFDPRAERETGVEPAAVAWPNPRLGRAPIAANWRGMRPSDFSHSSPVNDSYKGEANRQVIPILRDYLRERLPDHMVPSAFVMLEALPLTPNGKIDRKNLPPVDVGRPATANQGFVAPRGNVEQQIAGLWQELLSLETVGVNDNFFDLGGHSLLMMRVHGRLSEIYKGKLSIMDLLRYPTVSSLASFLTAQTDPSAINNVVEPATKAGESQISLRRAAG